MAVTIQMSENKEFKRSLGGGYDPKEVDEFLDEICDEMQSMQDDISSLQTKLRAATSAGVPGVYGSVPAPGFGATHKVPAVSTPAEEKSPSSRPPCPRLPPPPRPPRLRLRHGRTPARRPRSSWPARSRCTTG